MINFHVTETQEIRQKRADGLPGPLLGRYLPGLSYRLTPGNEEKVREWAAEGVARMGVPDGSAAAQGFGLNAVVAAPGSVTGTVKTD